MSRLLAASGNPLGGLGDGGGAGLAMDPESIFEATELPRLLMQVDSSESEAGGDAGVETQVGSAGGGRYGGGSLWIPMLPRCSSVTSEMGSAARTMRASCAFSPWLGASLAAEGCAAACSAMTARLLVRGLPLLPLDAGSGSGGGVTGAETGVGGGVGVG